MKTNANQLALLEHSPLRDSVFLVIQPAHLAQEYKYACHVYQDLDYQVMENVFDYVQIQAI